MPFELASIAVAALPFPSCSESELLEQLLRDLDEPDLDFSAPPIALAESLLQLLVAASSDREEKAVAAAADTAAADFAAVVVAAHSQEETGMSGYCQEIHPRDLVEPHPVLLESVHSKFYPAPLDLAPTDY